MIARLLCLAASFALAESIVTVLYRLLPNELNVKTDIVGFPIFANFDVNQLFYWYYLQGVLFPLLAFALWIWLKRRWSLEGPLQPFARVEPTPSAWLCRLRADLRAIAVGLLLGLIVAPWGAQGLDTFRPVVVAVTLIYFLIWALCVKRLANFRPRLSQSAWGSLLNLVFLPLIPLVLWRASAVTRVVEPSGLVRHFPWFPLWLALACCLAAAGILWYRVWKDSSENRLRDLERKALFLFAVPVLIFLSRSNLARPAGFQVFHDGETLVPPVLLARGYFPWRDLIFAHGLFHDVLRAGLGHWLFEESFWGAEMGVAVIAAPLWWVASYLFFYQVFGTNILFTLGLAFLLPYSFFAFQHDHFRFLLQWFALLAQVALWKRSNWLRAGVFSGLVLAQAILTPESAYSVIALGLALLVFDFVHRDFSRTRRVAAWGAGLFSIWCAFLAYHGALRGFFEYYVFFVRDHRYTGGIPFANEAPGYRFYSYLPLAANSVFIFWFLSKLRSRAEIAVRDWAMLSCSLFSVLYYQKYLARADSHVYSVFCMSLPVIFWVFFQVLRLVDERLGSRLPRFPRIGTFAAVAVVFVAFSPQWGRRIQELPSRFVARASRSPWSRFGYVNVSDSVHQTLTQWRDLLDSRLGPDDKVFDFSNAPGLMFYLLDRKPATRFFHISMAIRSEAQQAVIAELERERPKLVIFSAPSDLRGWDGISEMVRHYEVSDYLMRHYQPAVAVGKGLVLERKDTSEKREEGLHFNAPSCNWGYIPHFLKLPSSIEERTHDLRFRTRMRGQGYITEIDLGSVPAEKARYLELRFKSLFADAFVLSDQKHQAMKPIAFQTLNRTDQTYRVPVSSCLQWHGFEGERLSLTYSQPQELVAVRLVE